MFNFFSFRYLHQFEITYEKEIFESIVPAPNSIPCILKNDPFVLYMFFKPGIINLNEIEA